MARVANSVLDHSQPRQTRRHRQSGRTLQEAQEEVYGFLLTVVKEWSPEDVLDQFQQLFFEYGETTNSNLSSALYVLLMNNNEQEFYNTLKRSCYILVNNWEVSRQYQAIQALLELFDTPSLLKRTLSPTLKRLREWMLRFIDSPDYRELQLFAARYAEDARQNQWSSRYTSYLLVPQYVNVENPIEQREAARALSKRLKDKFKFDLAMYTAHSQHESSSSSKFKNPTTLGDSVLRLIKAIVARKGKFGYKNLAHLFLEQVKGLDYLTFKRSFIEYLTYSVNQPRVVKTLRQHLGSKFDLLYAEYDKQVADTSLQLRTCNRVIDYLMTEDQRSPSPLFTLLLSQGSSISLAILLLKLVLISKNSHHYLEARIANLINYYEQFPKDQCVWVINFLEVFQVTFAIYAENVEYNLIAPNQGKHGVTDNELDCLKIEDLETYRIFSRMISGHEEILIPSDQGGIGLESDDIELTEP